MIAIETPRLRIRPFTLEDLERCHAILDAGPDGDSLEQRRAWLEWTIMNCVQLERLHEPPYGDRAIVCADTGELLGACGLVPSMGPFAQLPGEGRGAAPRRARCSPEVGLYYALDEAHRGRGFATEAARGLITWARERLDLGRIVATTTYDNERSIKVMGRLGMRIERNPLPEPHWFQVVGILDLQRVVPL
ncbi:GNAT family N-acetyltransferase [Sorangium sp. So ce269]